jgi:diguanylate cyclase (GGDEF)-like protein
MLLQRDVVSAQAQLQQLRVDVAEAESQLGGCQAAQLLEANEQLLLSSLRLQSDAKDAAESAAAALKQASRWGVHDVLTELPNRMLMLDRLTQAIAAAKRRGQRAAVLFLDLNNFKQVNDTLGHAAGDEVLKLVAQRLTTAVRAADTVSRHGGDEFVILLTEVAQAVDAVALADKISAALGMPSRIGDQVIRLSASIGISLFPDDGDEADQLIGRADMAMYVAKRQSLRCYVFTHAAAQPELAVSGLPSLQEPLVTSALAHAEHEHHYAMLREANEHLVRAAINAQSLQSAAQQAQLRQKETLMMVAHELRNPLSPMRAAAAMLGMGRTDAQLQDRVRGIIERQVTHMARLVDDLLDMSRASTGKLRLQRGLVDMVALIDAAVGSCRPAMDARLQQFAVSMPAGALLIEGDPVRLTQVVCNLLDNASKYTQNGGEIQLAVTANEQSLAIVVSDNGIGITAEALPVVFEPFAQDQHAIAFNGVGLGLGLTVVRELVEAHGGTVAASSPGAGQGTRFVVTLPVRAADGDGVSVAAPAKS